MLFVATTATKPLLAVAEQAGLMRASLVEILGATEHTLRDPEQKIPVERYLLLWEYVARALRDPALPVSVAGVVRAEDYHLAGFAIMTSANGREVLTRLQRYSRLHTNSDRWTLQECADAAVLQLSHARIPLGLGYRLVKECLFAKITAMVRRIDQADFVPRWVHFRHAAPTDVRPLQRFLGIAPDFGMDEDSMAFDVGFLSRVPKTANRAFNEHFVAEAERRLACLDTTVEVADRVRKEIACVLPSGEPTMTNVAGRLAMTERTLRRHLELECKTFRELVDEVRRCWAPELLRRGNVSEVALMLGFNSTSAFGRAFKRWYGVSPRGDRSSVSPRTRGVADSDRVLSSRDASVRSR